MVMVVVFPSIITITTTSTTACLFLVVLLSCHESASFAPTHYIIHNKKNENFRNLVTKQKLRDTYYLCATSSKELRKLEADEREARIERRRRKNKSPNNKVSKSAAMTDVEIASSEAALVLNSRCNEHTTKDNHSSSIVVDSNNNKRSNATIAGQRQQQKQKQPTIKSLPKSALTTRLQQATARAKVAAEKVQRASQRQQAEESFLLSGDQNKAIHHSRNSSNVNDKQQQQQQQQQPSPGTVDRDERLGTLRQLTKIIDKELLNGGYDGGGRATFNSFNVHGTTNPPPGITQDSMRSLLEENEIQWKKRKGRQQQQQKQRHKGIFSINRQQQQQEEETTTKVIQHIAVIISKPLVQDQVTLEYACRLRSLARTIQDGQQRQREEKMTMTAVTGTSAPDDDDDNQNDNDDDTGDDDEESGIYKPSIICFVGETTKGNLVADADAGYIYFKHLCASNDISLDGIDIMLEKSTLGKGALMRVMQHLRQEYIPEWLKDKPDLPSGAVRNPLLDSDNDNEDEDEDEDDELSEIQMKRRQQQSKKVHLHFTLFSCDYDLCRLNDIHYRSPQKSVLRPLLEIEDNEVEGTTSRARGQAPVLDSIETSWSYRYTPYPYIHAPDSVTAFLGKCYLMAEELTPVLVNIRSVVDGTEFFQRDNYRVLVSIRRSFVNDMERFYQNQPSLKSTLRQYVSRSDYPLDIVLEGALLSLGRCLDLVRPAGLLIGCVSNSDWKNAEMVLEHAVSQMRDACDPDHPLDPADWGLLDHHYDPSAKKGHAVESSGNDLFAKTQWRVEDGEEQEEGEEEIVLFNEEDTDNDEIEITAL